MGEEARGNQVIGRNGKANWKYIVARHGLKRDVKSAYVIYSAASTLNQHPGQLTFKAPRRATRLLKASARESVYVRLFLANTILVSL